MGPQDFAFYRYMLWMTFCCCFVNKGQQQQQQQGSSTTATVMISTRETLVPIG